MRTLLALPVMLPGSLLLTLLTLLTPHAAAFAAVLPTLEMCHQRNPEDRAVHQCVESERRRAANELREANQSTLIAVRQKVKTEGRRNALRGFQLSQAQHVRIRAARCRMQRIDVERTACEADADFTQVDHLKQLAD